MLDHRDGKSRLFALTDGIAFEYGLTEGGVIQCLPFKPGDTELVLDHIHRWPAVDPLRFSDDIDQTKQHIESFCRVVLRQGQLVETPPVTPDP